MGLRPYLWRNRLIARRDPLGKGIRIPLVPDWKHEKEPEGLELTAEDLDEGIILSCLDLCNQS